jgi:hypothetical protein
MARETYELSLTPKYLKRIEEIITAGGRSSLYGPEEAIAAMKQPNFDNERMWGLLRGSYDIHQHTGPSSTTQRLFSQIEFARQACEVGQAGIVCKDHTLPTSPSVQLTQIVVDQWAAEHNKKRVEVFGGVVLNYAVGGLNPDAVVASYRVGGKYIWLPNMDAAHHRKVTRHPKGGGISVIDEKGNVVPEMKEILKLMAETDMVLGLCHQSTTERLAVVREAVKMGVERIEVNHVNYPLTMVTPAQAKELADMGAYIGIYAMHLAPPAFVWDEAMAFYRAVGPERIVLGSDTGHIETGLPWEQMRKLILGFLFRGVPDEHVRMMCQTNAHNLLH